MAYKLINSAAVQVPKPYLGAWEDTSSLHQAMWENRLPEATQGSVKAVINHAPPMPGLRDMDELLAAWSASDLL
jgi:acrylyl-CoA reductase (NADPH)/3-hydroxypropionyl-CoA dehydratase/3-hydroxypropionyl-CoA synthetase